MKKIFSKTILLAGLLSSCCTLSFAQQDSGISVFEIAPTYSTSKTPILQQELNKNLTPYQKYKITDEDIKLISSFPNYSIKKYESIDNSTFLEIPTVEMRNFVRKGILPDGQFWIVYFTEIYPNHFSIKGTNSTGNKVDEDCGKLYDCFPLI